MNGQLEMVLMFMYRVIGPRLRMEGHDGLPDIGKIITVMVITGYPDIGTKFKKSKKMNKFILVYSIFVFVFLFAFTKKWNSPVKGKVNPSDAALRAWVYGPDTLNAAVISGYFQINNVKSGNYILVIEGKPPYRNSSKDGIVVVDGQPTDVGTIEMQK
jgi:hypothetical protein